MPTALPLDDAKNAVLVVVAIIGESPQVSENALVAALEARGFSHVHAEKLCAFVPSAFSWTLLKKMGVESFPDHYLALDRRGQPVELPISEEQYFLAAHEIAEQVLEKGWHAAIDRRKFEDTAFRSAEYGALIQALNAGKSLRGAVLLPTTLRRISAESAREAR